MPPHEQSDSNNFIVISIFFAEDSLELANSRFFVPHWIIQQLFNLSEFLCFAEANPVYAFLIGLFRYQTNHHTYIKSHRSHTQY